MRLDKGWVSAQRFSTRYQTSLSSSTIICFVPIQMSSSSSRSFITRESFEDIQILAMKNLMRVPADIEPYYLGAALKMEKPMKSKQMVLEWLRTKKIGILLNYSSEWKRGVSPFVKEKFK